MAGMRLIPMNKICRWGWAVLMAAQLPAREIPAAPSSDSAAAEDSAATEDFDFLSIRPSVGEFRAAEEKPSWFKTWIADPSRLTLEYENSYKLEVPRDVRNNRAAFRLEFEDRWSRLSWKYDSKLTAYLWNDHKALADGEDLALKHRFHEAYLQLSLGDVSAKAGYQKVIWGESDVAAITDDISPRDYSEWLFVALDESRISQAMVSLERFSAWGDLSAFYIPKPAYNKYPEKGTAYYIDPFQGMARFEDAGETYHEYGGRWRKTLVNSDVSVMAARLINNDYALAAKSPGVFGKVRNRYEMYGMAFNWVRGHFMLKGEGALKTSMLYPDVDFRLMEKEALDGSLALEYFNGETFTGTLELVDRHILGWDDRLLNVPENDLALVMNINIRFLQDKLSLNVTGMGARPHTSLLNSVNIGYRWSDNLSLFVNGYYPDVDSDASAYWSYRDQKQVSFKIQYQH